MSRSQVDIVRSLHAMVGRAFEHRSMLRKAAVLVRLWPTGLAISVQVRESDHVTSTLGPRVISWETLETIDEAELLKIVDEVCAPAHALLRNEGGTT